MHPIIVRLDEEVRNAITRDPKVMNTKFTYEEKLWARDMVQIEQQAEVLGYKLEIEKFHGNTYLFTVDWSDDLIPLRERKKRAEQSSSA